jgi:pyruvate dehydrogenase (quinone)
MADTVGAFILSRLVEWGIRRVFGFPGDGINGIFTAFARVPELELIQVRHEEGAAFMACAHAKFTGQVGVCMATSGPGAIHLLNGLLYWKRWRDPRLIVLVLNNRDLNQVTWEMRAMVGDPKLEASQDVPDFPFARYAESLGLLGLRMDRPDDIGPIWDQALRADRPVVIEARTDPDVPPLPPHITLEQARNFSTAILKGDPDWAGVIEQAWKNVLAGK